MNLTEGNQTETNMFHRTFAIHTLGCKVNTYESDAISERLREAGFPEVPFSERADVYIINTCTVTNMADKKSRQMLHRARKKNPDALVVAVGCYVDALKRSGKEAELAAEHGIDLMVSNRDKGKLVRLIGALLEEEAADGGVRNGQSGETFAGEEKKAAAERSAETAGEKMGPGSAAQGLPDAAESGEDAFEALCVTELDGHTRAFLKVQDGCNQFCSYCIIPYVRGRIRTRAIDRVVAEVERLAAKGVAEVVLTGIHISSYGKDWERRAAAENQMASGAAENAGEREALPKETAAETGVNDGGISETAARLSDDIVSGTDAPLLALIRAVSAVPGILRVRLSSLEPRLMTEAFVSELAKIEKVCPHFHLSLQSGADETLKRMNRHYTTADYRESCRVLRAHYEHPAITTDIIVGFPGETDALFDASYAFAEEIGFYEAHIFKYSRREGTVADRMDGQLDEQVKTRRSDRLLALTEQQSHAFRAYYLGKDVEFLAETTMELDGVLYETGYTREYVRCLKRTDALHRNALCRGRAAELVRVKGQEECLLLA